MCGRYTKNYRKHKSTLVPTVFGQCVNRENHVGANIGASIFVVHANVGSWPSVEPMNLQHGTNMWTLYKKVAQT